MNTNERIARWLGWHRDEGRWVDSDGASGYPLLASSDFDSDLSSWHGPDGLLEEIERRGMWVSFCREYVKIVGTGLDTPALTALRLVTMGLRATPAQLSAALVAVIGE